MTKTTFVQKIQIKKGTWQSTVLLTIWISWMALMVGILTISLLSHNDKNFLLAFIGLLGGIVFHLAYRVQKLEKKLDRFELPRAR